MSENRAMPQPMNTRLQSSPDREFSERSLDAVVSTPPVGGNVVNLSNPAPESEDFDA